MTIEIIISPTLSSSLQSVELQYYRCHCHDDGKRNAYPTKKSSDEYCCNCFRSSIIQKLEYEQEPSNQSPFSHLQSMIVPIATTSLHRAVKGEGQVDQYNSNDHQSLSFSSSSDLSFSLYPSCEKSVRFNIESSEVIPYLHWRDMTDEEIQATWFTYGEKKQYRREATMTKRIMQDQQMPQGGLRSNIINEKSRDSNPYYCNDEFSLSLSSSSSYGDEEDEVIMELCNRGLEGRHQRLIGISRHIVLEEQGRQYLALRKHCRQCLQDSNNNKFLHERENMINRGHMLIATRYRSITEDAIILARQRARQDSNEVKTLTTSKWHHCL